MDLTFQVPMQYCFYSIRLYIHHQSHQNWVLFLVWLHLFILSEVISPLFSSSILSTYGAGEIIFQCPLFAFSHCSCGSQSKDTEVVCHSLLQWTTFYQNPSTVTHPSWVALHGMAHSFIELDKAVVCVIRLASFL